MWNRVTNSEAFPYTKHSRIIFTKQEKRLFAIKVFQVRNHAISATQDKQKFLFVWLFPLFYVANYNSIGGSPQALDKYEQEKEA